MKELFTLEELLAIKEQLELENGALKAALEKESTISGRYVKRIEREKIARKEAEKILEIKSLELYKTTEKLMLLNYSLESQVAERTEELKQMIKSLEKANNDIYQFTYLASHDLKTPLRAIGSLLGFLEQDLYETPEVLEAVKETIDLMKNRVNRMHRLLNSVLEYSNIGRKEITKHTTDVFMIINEVLESLPLESNDAIFLHEPFFQLNTNKHRLHKVIKHIIDNAIKYHEPTKKKKIDIFSKVGEKWYELHIQDNGFGIPERYHERIFQIFQTLNTKDKNSGSIGIGLPIVKKIMEEEMKGQLLMESEEGKGTTFIFRFPIEDIVY
jgi:light-regulated signal transduction histidine kinase (bacteriophytochrome)